MAMARGIVRRIAAERIEILYDAAVGAFPRDKELSRGYIKLLEEIGRHYKVRIPKETAARICKRCLEPLIEGLNVEVRVIGRERRAIYRCRGCGKASSLDFK